MILDPNLFDASLEIGVFEFSSFEDWKRWRTVNPWFGFSTAPKEIAETCCSRGINSSWFGHIPPHNVSCNTDNYRESLRANGFNPRQRAIFEILLAITRGRSNDKKIYAAEGITLFARELKSRFASFVGSEYAPSEADRTRIAPIEHQDLASLTYADSSFDICISNEVFEHLPNLKGALSELHRVLKPDGLIINTFPFLHNCEKGKTKAYINENGELRYLMEPEYHGNPMDPNGGSLVFHVPGWDIIEMARAAGFSKASMVLLSSKKAGLTSRDYAGIFVFMAKKGSVAQIS